MKSTRSLAISARIHQGKRDDIIGALDKVLPIDALEQHQEQTLNNTRKRVFTPTNTLLTMVLSAVMADKSLQQAVQLFHKIHQQHREKARQNLTEQIDLLQQAQIGQKRGVGRPRKYEVKLPQSILKDISLNTAAYAKARQRVPLSLVEQFFEASRIEQATNNYSHWEGYRVMIADGTYLQLQDTPSIKAAYPKQSEQDAYPQALLTGIIERGTGQIHSYRLAGRDVSELALVYAMIDPLPERSLLLADDLYNCYEIIAKCKRKGVELVVPGKRLRNYRVVARLGPGDEIVEISPPQPRSKWLSEHEKAEKHLLRRLALRSPCGKKWVLYTTLLEKNISKESLGQLYQSRWDIEVSIRELKTIMELGIVRSRSSGMVIKEVGIVLGTYNLLRKLIYASLSSLSFSP